MTETTGRTKKMIIGGAIALAIAAGSYIAFPHIQRAYKKYRAESLITETTGQATELKQTITDARNTLENNMFIMTGDDETRPLRREISDSSEQLDEIEKSLEEAESDFNEGRFDEVRTSLDDTFGLEDDQTRETPASVARREKGDLTSKVIGYCNGKRKARDTVVSNEWLLRARLKKPRDPGMLEKEGEVLEIPDKFFGMIAIARPGMLEALAQFSPEQSGEPDLRLYNSMGANLLRDKPSLEHILQHGANSKVKDNSRNMYMSALGAYWSVRPKNDELIWYRAKIHDGTFSMDDYRGLLARQDAVINLIHNGDNQLRRLAEYFKELHEQYFIYVSDQSKEETTFTHLDVVPSTDSDGNVTLKTETRREPGYKFYYTLTTVTPSGSRSEEIYVGEEEGRFASWSYSNDEEVGWVRKWKRLHYDNSQILSGRREKLNPHMEKTVAGCGLLK